MPQDQLVQLPWPRGGFVESSLAFADNEPGVTPACLNVRNYDSFDRRNRGGKRPMLVKLFSTEPNGAVEIQLMRETVEALDLIESAGYGEKWSVSTTNLDVDSRIAWSPDGTRVLRTQDSPTTTDPSVTVYIVDEDAQTLTTEDTFLRSTWNSVIGGAGNPEDAVWAPDGNTIYVISNDRVAAIPYTKGVGFGTAVRLNPTGTPTTGMTAVAITNSTSNQHLILNSSATPFIFAMPVSGTSASPIITAPATVAFSNIQKFGIVVNEDDDVVFAANQAFVRAWRFNTVTGWGTSYTDAPSATLSSLTRGLAVRPGTTHLARSTDSSTPSLDVNEIWPFNKVSGFGTKTVTHTTITFPRKPSFHPNGDFIWLAGPDMNDGTGTDSQFNTWTFSGVLNTRINDPSSLGADPWMMEWNPAGTAVIVSQGTSGTVGAGLEAWSWTNGGANPSARENRLVVVSGGSVFRSNTAIDSLSLVSSGTDAFRIDGPVDGQVAFQKLFFTDGLFANYQFLDFADNTLKDWTSNLTAGALPRGITDTTIGARYIEVYRGRTVLFGNKEEPQNWYMSAAQDPFDFDYFPAVTSQTQAVAGNNSEAGELGDILTACAPYQDDLMVMGGTNSIWVMRGDPAAGGAIDNISRKIGIVGPEAWTFDTGANFYFMGRNGLYRMSLGTFQPVLISQDRLDNTFLDIDYTASQVLLSYDAKAQGVHVFISAIDQPGTAPTHYFYDERNDAFWPEQYEIAYGPFSILDFNGDTAELTGVFLGGYDGFIRRFEKSATTDDGADVVSFIRFPSLNLGQSIASNRMDDLVILTDSESSTLKVNIYVGDTIEQVEVNADAGEIRATKSVVGGRNQPMRRRVTQNAVVVELRDSGVGGTRWAFERATARVAVINRMRGKRT